MALDPHQISLYTLAHDWWGVAAFGYGLYKVLNYLKSFKENSDAALLAINEVKADMSDGRQSIRAELKTQTDSMVGALDRGMTELRQMIFTLSHGPSQHSIAPRPIRAKNRKIVVDNQVEL
jgi:hypothetical protein